MIGSEEDARSFCSARCDLAAFQALERFVGLLARENEKQNLVSKPSVGAVWQRHIADSLQLLDHVPGGAAPWLDLGSGAGFPGLALAIARPELPIVLVESRKRRIEWLTSVINELQLQHCVVRGSRLETVESFDAAVITARAFAPLSRLVDLSARFSTRSTVWLLPKGRSGEQELAEQKITVRAMFHVEQSVTDAESKILVGRGRPPVR